MADNVEDSAPAKRAIPRLQRAIRLFVTSTFSELVAERNASQEYGHA